MPIAITIPRLGWNMEEGVLVGWLRSAGEAVRAGDPLFTLEGEKAAQDVEAAEDGILWIDPSGPQPNATVTVGAVVGAILRPGETADCALRIADCGLEEKAHAAREAAGGEAAQGADATAVEFDPAARRDRPRATPLARRLAREMGVDLAALQGGGTSGRIRKADVLAAAQGPPPTAFLPAIPQSAIRNPQSVVPIGARRRTIAARMIESRATTAPVTLTTTVDATNLVNLRDQFRAAGEAAGPVPSYTDFLVRLAALALRDHPMLNARWAGDRIELAAGAHVGIAVDAEAGLLVPVVRGAAGLGLRQIAERTRDLIARARAGTLAADEMQGGTFTITNLGAFGIEAFTPIINLPECAILGVGRIARTPALVGERIEARERLTLSLTFDHRIVDGAPAARFLQDLGRRIENPGPWLLS